MQTTLKKPRVKRCPECGGRALRIICGKPLPETLEAAVRGELVLGGCSVTEGLPDWGCRQCGYEW